MFSLQDTNAYTTNKTNLISARGRLKKVGKTLLTDIDGNFIER